jgi:hypothetical protein
MDDDPTPGGGVREAHDWYSTDPVNLAHVVSVADGWSAVEG